MNQLYLDLLLMWALRDASDEGVYAFDLLAAIARLAGFNPTMGQLFSGLKRLRRRGYIDDRPGEPIGHGQHRSLYYLTPHGLKALAAFDDAAWALKTWSQGK